MSLKLLIADDSLTIQKVIKIALVNENFDISVCSKSDDLLNSVKEHDPKIVLLDFNLSEDRNGIELAQDILRVSPDIQILMLYRTFDTIDEELLKKVGVANSVVKPFDGNEFINKCRSMRQHIENNNSELQEQIIPERISDTNDEVVGVENEDSDPSDEWVMNVPDVENDDVDSSLSFKEKPIGKLEQDLADWGMDVPSIIGMKSDKIEIPGIIGSDESISSSSDIKYPSNDDLEYPDMEDLKGPSSKLISLDDLEPSISEDDNDDKTTEFEMNITEDESGKIHVEHLEREISDEVLDSEDDLWAADEIVEADTQFTSLDIEEEDLPMVEPHKLHEVMKATPELSHLLDSFDGAPSDFPDDVMSEFKTVDQKSIEDKIKADLTPIIEDYIKNYCNDHIERIAWEVIPDLAENIIKKEIRRISENIISSEV